MTLGVKILTAAAILCLLLWVAFLAIGAQPLKEISSLSVIYGEHEDFFADASVYQKMRNETQYFLHLPHARPLYRWWSVDLKDKTISMIGEPRFAGSRKYLLRGDLQGTALENTNGKGEWSWHFTESGAAFSGSGFMCKVRRTAQ